MGGGGVRDKTLIQCLWLLLLLLTPEIYNHCTDVYYSSGNANWSIVFVSNRPKNINLKKGDI